MVTQEMNALQPPPGFNNQMVGKKPSVEDLLGSFILEAKNSTKMKQGWTTLKHT